MCFFNTSLHTLCWREPSNWICTYFISRESQNRRRAGLTTLILFHKRSKHFSRDDIQMLQYHQHHIYVFKIKKIMASNWVLISYPFSEESFAFSACQCFTQNCPTFYRNRVRSPLSLTDILRLCHLIDLIDVTLACEDPNSKLVEVVTVADVDINIMMLRNMLTTVWCRFGS